MKEANYSNGDYYHYTYDAVGNRLSQGRMVNSLPDEWFYEYDAANRLIVSDEIPYTWDNNGNLLNDGVNTYVYDSANRLTSISGGQTATYAYNGFGDRLSQNGVNYTLDLNAGLTQVLNDGTNQYLYGLGRISQVNTTTDYFLTDALGSVRQLTDAQGQVTLANAYEPYGVLMQSAGGAQTSYGFTGEFTDPSGMVYLRARYYAPNDGRFLTRDTWMGDYNSPLSLNRWNYTYSNPINYVDSSGYITESESVDATEIVNRLRTTYNVQIRIDWGYRPIPYYSSLPSSVASNYPTGCYWENGNWRALKELELTEQAIKDISTKLGGSDKFIAAMRRVNVNRVKDGLPWSPPPPILSTLFGGDLVLADSLFDQSDRWIKYVIVHELGHRWDYETNFRLSRGLMEALGTWICDKNGSDCHWYPYALHVNPDTLQIIWEPPAGVRSGCSGRPPFNDDCPEAYALSWGVTGREPWLTAVKLLEWGPGIEDWAESLANVVYPNYYPSTANRLSGLVPGGIREKYVRAQINSLP